MQTYCTGGKKMKKRNIVARLAALALPVAMVIGMLPALNLSADASSAPISKWDGTVDYDWYLLHPGGTIYTINTAAEFAGFASRLNNFAGLTFVGETIRLNAELDMGGYQWTPAGKGNKFQGKFEGADMSYITSPSAVRKAPLLTSTPACSAGPKTPR
jgi:hypothetical protein